MHSADILHSPSARFQPERNKTMKHNAATMSHLSKREERKAMNAMKREIEEILNTYDFTNFA